MAAPEAMIKGILTANLDPPYLVLDLADAGPLRSRRRECTSEEIRSAIFALGENRGALSWPPKDCVVRIQGAFSQDWLASIGLEIPQPE